MLTPVTRDHRKSSYRLLLSVWPGTTLVPYDRNATTDASALSDGKSLRDRFVVVVDDPGVWEISVSAAVALA